MAEETRKPKNALEMAEQTLADEAKKMVPEGFQEIEWSNPLAKTGDQVKGRYIDKGETVVKGKKINVYRLEKADGEVVVIRGVHQIDASMMTAKIGDDVWFLRGKEIPSAGGKVTLYRFALKRG